MNVCSRKGGGHHRTQGGSYPRPEAVWLHSLSSSVDRQRVTWENTDNSCVRDTNSDIWCFRKVASSSISSRMSDDGDRWEELINIIIELLSRVVFLRALPPLRSNQSMYVCVVCITYLSLTLTLTKRNCTSMYFWSLRFHSDSGFVIYLFMLSRH